MAKQKTDRPLKDDASFLEIVFKFEGTDRPETAVISSRERPNGEHVKKSFNLNTETGRRKCCFEIYRLYDMMIVESCRWNLEEADDFLSGL